MDLKKKNNPKKPKKTQSKNQQPEEQRNPVCPTCHLLSDRHHHSSPPPTDHARMPARTEETFLTPDRWVVRARSHEQRQALLIKEPRDDLRSFLNHPCLTPNTRHWQNSGRDKRGNARGRGFLTESSTLSQKVMGTPQPLLIWIPYNEANIMVKQAVLQHTSGTGRRRVIDIGGRCFAQQPGKNLILFPLRRDMNRKEMKSTIPHSLPKSASDIRRVYSGRDRHCLLFG